MSHIKTMFHKFFRTSSHQTQEKMIQRWRAIIKLKGGVWNTQCVRFFNEHLTHVRDLGMQCNVIAAHRARRTAQIMQLYNKLYGRKSASQVFENLREWLKFSPKDKVFLLLGAAFFDWNSARVTDNEMKMTEEDLKPFLDCRTSETTVKDQEGEVWEKIVDKEDFKLWRCPVHDSSLYKYKVFGTYSDVPATAFFNIQLDLDYRKQWDSHVIRLEKVEVDEQTGSEVIYWATHFPLGFLYSRDYLFVRRYKVNEETKTMMLTSTGVDHPSFPATDKYVRVSEYKSQMLIRPHKTFDENGFDYVMSYYDNPQLYVPSWAINKMSVQHLPAFLEELHAATVKLVKSNVKISGYHSSPNTNQGNTNNNNNSSSYLSSQRIRTMS